MLSDKPADVLADELLDYIVSVASRVKTKNEQNDYRDISILKDGVVL
jgi:altronate dehydratase